MMSLAKMLTLVGVVATVSVSAASFAPPARAAGVEPAKVSTSRVAERSAFSDTDVLEFLATGRGALATEFPDLVQYLPRTDKRLASGERKDLLREYLNADPQFHKHVTLPLQSGDAYRTLSALKSFQKTTAVIAGHHGSSDAGMGDGKCATLVAVALWLVVVLAVAVVVPASVPEESGSEITTESFSADLAMAFTVRAAH